MTEALFARVCVSCMHSGAKAYQFCFQHAVRSHDIHQTPDTASEQAHFDSIHLLTITIVVVVAIELIVVRVVGVIATIARMIVVLVGCGTRKLPLAHTRRHADTQAASDVQELE